MYSKSSLQVWLCILLSSDGACLPVRSLVPSLSTLRDSNSPHLGGRVPAGSRICDLLEMAGITSSCTVTMHRMSSFKLTTLTRHADTEGCAAPPKWLRLRSMLCRCLIPDKAGETVPASL